MVNPHPRRRGQRIPRSRATASSAIPSTGRRASFLVFACTIPFAVIVLIWQHAQLMERLEGGGEYSAYVEVEDDDSEDELSWGDSVQQAVDVVKFVAYGSGWLSEKDDDYPIDDDDQVDEDTNSEIDEDTNSANLNSASAPSKINKLLRSASEQAGSIIPYDLSVNHLKLITDAPGKPLTQPLSPHASSASVWEDFLPVVKPTDISFRWRHQAKAGSSTENAAKVAAYRIEARRIGGILLWDSDKIQVDDELPFSSPWPATILPKAGEIIEWRVILWDVENKAHSSIWSKFAVGPAEESDWKGQWIAHPVDMNTFHKDEKKTTECERWKMRRSLPLFRAQLPSQTILPIIENEEDALVSALLVVSGLGSFRVSMDGVPLSASGPIDPPFTDYSKRVMYRGFDVTAFLASEGASENSHAIGISMGSGWWDHRPLSGFAKFDLLPRGPATIVAQLYLTTTKGNIHVVIPTDGSDTAKSAWQVTRGHIRESDLFTGEIVDVGVMSAIEGWDTPTGWSESERWVVPVVYHTDVSPQRRREEIAIRANAMKRTSEKRTTDVNFASPIGKLVPPEIPPILPMEQIAPDEIHDLGSGRWLFDFGKAFSGMLHFDEGLPTPIIPETYPRAHGFKAASEQGDSFITVIYGESLEMTTGDINRVLVAGLGLHDGGPRHVSNEAGAQDNHPCFPEDQDGILSQRDVFVSPKRNSGTERPFSSVRQSHFTTHSFRFAEICCTSEPPAGVRALVYRTAFSEWGTFDSSNVLINGGYELVKNAMVSNMLSVQSDCPHREKLPYGGDLVADSPAAMHMFDMSSFYKKTVQDWLDAQWDNGAYTETSIWQDLNDYAGIGHGAGETVWATAPPVITVRHMQHYGDLEFLAESLPNHIRWLEFLNQYFNRGMEEKGYDEDLRKYDGEGSGLGDWLALRGRDTFLTHTAFYMAAARCVAYIARKVGDEKMTRKSLAQAEIIRKRIASLYLMNGKDDFDFPRGHASHTPGPEMSLFSRIVPGEKRCVVLKNWFKRSGSIWPGDEETLFLKELDESYAQEMVRTGELVKESDGYHMGWSQWQGFNEGIFAIRYALKTLSDMGFHHIALRKAAGFGFATSEYMMRHNATTMWESWWRSEDLYSRNHPMLGAMAEWMSSSVAGVSHYPTTTGARKMLFWPRFPKSATTLEYASATQGTVRGDYSIAWRFEDLPADKSQYNSATVQVRVRFLVPPGGEGVVRPPVIASSKTTATLRHATIAPDLINAKSSTSKECKRRRKARLGFSYSWEFDREKEKWYKHESGKAIGTPCESYLFHSSLDKTKWDNGMDITSAFSQKTDMPIAPGLYEILFTNWPLEKEIEGTGRIGNIPEYYNSNDLGPYCKDSSTFEWDIDDGTHII
mmetsp:Transcript_40975/g.72060  ORF Transcript_40975/g.72060 Transcript_40975/m.72060 type:complete len:1376 (-) Transcript_40975:70-4197(-)